MQIVSVILVFLNLVLITASVASYGEKGWSIGMKSLRDIFPESFLGSQPHYVLANWSRVLECVLLPEVACHLISEDLGVTLLEAVNILDESSHFGRLAHPLED